MPAKKRPDVRFLLDTDRDDYSNSYVTAKMTCYVLAWTDDGMKQELLSPGYSYRGDRDYAANCLADLTISAQASPVSDDDDKRAEWYGWAVEFYRPFAVKLERAEEMVKVLRKIKSGMERHECEFGRPESFPAYAQLVARLAGAFEARPFAIRATPDRPSMDGGNYRWMDSEGLRYHLQDTATGKVKTTTRH